MTQEQTAVIEDLEEEYGFTYDEVSNATGFSCDGHGGDFDADLRAAFEKFQKENK